MQVAVTGSTGFIGSPLVERLRERGHTVIPVVRHDRPGVDEIAWDPSAGEIDAGAFSGIDAVVHLAGEPIQRGRWTDAQKRRILDSRVDGTTLLAETLATTAQPPEVLVSGSAIGYYGDRGDQRLTERDAAGRGFMAEVCIAWEESTAAAAEAGIRVCHARTGIVLDDSGGALAEQLPFFKLGLGGRIGGGRQYWSWISLEDEVRGLCWMLENPLSGPVNLTAPQPVTNAEFTRTLGDELNRPTLLPTPSLALYAKLGRQMARELLFSSARVEPAALLGSEFAFTHESLAAALHDIVGSSG